MLRLIGGIVVGILIFGGFIWLLTNISFTTSHSKKENTDERD